MGATVHAATVAWREGIGIGPETVFTGKINQVTLEVQ